MHLTSLTHFVQRELGLEERKARIQGGVAASKTAAAAMFSSLKLLWQHPQRRGRHWPWLSGSGDRMVAWLSG